MRLTVKRRRNQDGDLPFARVRVNMEDFPVTAEDVVGELGFLLNPRFCWGWS